MQFIKQFCHSLIAGGLIFSISLDAAPPSWWNAYSVISSDPNVSPNHYGPVTIGQFKHFANKAKQYIDAQLGTTQVDWDNAFFNQNTQTTDNPFVPTLLNTGHNYYLINQGQAKFVVNGIYEVLIAEGVDTEAALNATLASGQTWTHSKPWTDTLTDDANQSPLTQGQLKWMLSFVVAAVDLDLDLLNDNWEVLVGLNAPSGDQDGNGVLDSLDDFDGDGSSAADEYNDGVSYTSPVLKDNPIVGLTVLSKEQR